MTRLHDVAEHLLNQRNVEQPKSDLIDELAITSIEEAFVVQQLMINSNPNNLVGWKCLLPQDNGNLIVAPLIGVKQFEKSECEIIPVNDKALIEPEIAFVLAKDLLSGVYYSNEEIDVAIGQTRMALELIQPRFSNNHTPNHFERLADGLSNQGLYLGPEINRDAAYNAATISIEFTEGNNQQLLDGVHPCYIPQNPLYWLVNHLSRRGISLMAGHVIITGSYHGVLKTEPNTPLNIKYSDLGELNVTFIPK